MSQVKKIAAFGQSIWIDTIQTSFIQSGALQALIDRDGVVGLTSNPAIFEKAIANTDEYDQRLANNGITEPYAAFKAVAVDDIQQACAVLAPVFESSAGLDGWVSLEVSPELAHDADGTIAEAKALHQSIDRDNAMIKVPGTPAGIEAFEALTFAGISVNITLLFSVERYMAVAAAYIRGLQRRAEAQLPLDQIASVASFFVSRVDARVDAALAPSDPLRSQIAVANAKVAYGHYLNLFKSPQWQALAAAGAREQRLLFASTSTKDPALSACYYVDALIGADTVNTVPPATLDVYRDQGQPAARLQDGIDLAQQQLMSLASQGIDLAGITTDLESEGIEQFSEAFQTLLAAVSQKIGRS